MKRGIERDSASGESSYDEDCLPLEHEKHIRLESDEEFQQLSIALSLLKSGDNTLWQRIEQQIMERGMSWGLPHLRLAFNAALSGCHRPWNFIRQHLFNQNTKEHFQALETISFEFQNVNLQRQFTLRFNQLAQQTSLKGEVRMIEGGEAIEGLTTLIDEGLEELFKKISI